MAGDDFDLFISVTPHWRITIDLGAGRKMFCAETYPIARTMWNVVRNIRDHTPDWLGLVFDIRYLQPLPARSVSVAGPDTTIRCLESDSASRTFDLTEEVLLSFECWTLMMIRSIHIFNARTGTFSCASMSAGRKLATPASANLQRLL